MNKLNVYQREYESLKTEIDAKVQAVCSSGRYILGKEVEDFDMLGTLLEKYRRR